MPPSDAIDPEAFKQFEHSGWAEVANQYHDSFAPLTTQAIEPLLDAAAVRPGIRVLDVATGPGYIAAAAVRRGALAVGLDFSATMVEEARRLHPGIEFREGDAEALPFGEGEFDAVIIGFGLLHFGKPERSVAEAFRVLNRGGRIAFSVWDAPERAITFGLVRRAIETHGNMQVPLPPGPDFFRFSDHAESRRLLEQAGFASARVESVPPELDAGFRGRAPRHHASKWRSNARAASGPDTRGAKSNPHRTPRRRAGAPAQRQALSADAVRARVGNQTLRLFAFGGYRRGEDYRPFLAPAVTSGAKYEA